MNSVKTYLASLLMVIFCSYYAGISMFSHAHIVNGTSVIHSHLGGGAEHDHSDSQYAVIDILSHFQSEVTSCFYGVGTLFHHPVQKCECCEFFFVRDGECSVPVLRGPPQA